MPNGPARAQVEVVTLPLPSGASTEATLLSIKAKTDNLDVLLSSRTTPADTQIVSVANAPDIADRADRLLGHVVVDAMPVGVSGLTNAELRAAPINVSGVFYQAAQPVSQYGAWSVSVSGSVAVSGPMTDAQLRATAVAVTGAFYQATQPVSGPLTDTQLRAATVPVSVAAMPLPSGASTEATLAAIKAKTDNLDVALSTRTKPADTQPVSGAFWQATQPVSLAVNTPDVSDRVGRLLGHITVDNASIPVTGAFWQATQPVSIAAQVKAREDTAAMTWVSLKTAAPAASAVQADTGALAAGDYDFTILLSAADTLLVGKGMVIEHRNAANAATLQTLGGVVAGGSENVELRRYTMALNERLRVIAGTAAGAASSMYVSAIGRRVA